MQILQIREKYCKLLKKLDCLKLNWVSLYIFSKETMPTVNSQMLFCSQICGTQMQNQYLQNVLIVFTTFLSARTHEGIINYAAFNFLPHSRTQIYIYIYIYAFSKFFNSKILLFYLFLFIYVFLYLYSHLNSLCSLHQ